MGFDYALGPGATAGIVMLRRFRFAPVDTLYEVPMTDRPPRDPTVGLPSWPSKTATAGAVSSRQAERDAAIEEQHQYCAPEERRHREVIGALRVVHAKLDLLSEDMKRIGDLLLEMSRQPRSF